MSSDATGKQKVIVVMPAYNAEQTLEQTLRDLPEAGALSARVIDELPTITPVAV